MCKEVGYELSPADKWMNSMAMDEESATEWIRRLKENVYALCFDAVGVSVDDLRGVEWLNEMGRAGRDGCVVADMQYEDVVKSIRRLVDDPECLWLQVDVSGGWAPCDTPCVVDDRYVAASALDEAEAGVSGAVTPLRAPQVALAIRDVSGELGLPWDDGGDNSDSDVDMGSSPLAVRAEKRLAGSGERRAGRAGPL